MLKSKHQWIAFAVATLVGLGNSIAAAGIVTSNEITGSNPSAFSTYTTGMVTAAGVAASGISRGPGLSAPNGASANAYQAVGWSTGALDSASGYFSFVITPDAGGVLDIDSFTYFGKSGGQGPTSFAFRSSLDGFSSNLGTATEGLSGTTINLGSAFDNITSGVEFRFYAFNANKVDDSSSRYGIESYSFGGNFTAVPEPSSLMLVGLAIGGTVLTRKRRRR